MFSDDKYNLKMLEGAYKKLKSYYHYNKTFLFMREKIAAFEYDSITMKSTLQLLSGILKNPSLYTNQVEKWIDSIDYYVLPKSFVDEKSLDERIVTSSLPKKSITKVNFFINMPIELHLLETLWTTLISKIAFDNNIIQECSYGNAIDDKLLFDKSKEEIRESIRFDKNRLFKIYFQQYCDWKNKAIDIVDKYKNKKNTVLVSLDIKSFFYSTQWKFSDLNTIIKDTRLEQIVNLTHLVERIFKTYTIKLSNVRLLTQKLERDETVLPIGLFSSMFLSNIYMSKYDMEVLKGTNVLYYGRYVDDILLILNVDHTGFTADDSGLDKLLVSDNVILSKIDSKNYRLLGYDDLVIQREKMKAIYFERGRCEGIITQLRNSKIIPSQMNIIPSDDTQIIDFEEAAYTLQNFSTETKIRDLGHLEINKFKLACHMIELVCGIKHINTSKITKEVWNQRKSEKEKVVSFFSGSNAIEYCSNWINAFYFFLLSSPRNKKDWNRLEFRIRDAIKRITISRLEDINKGHKFEVKAKIKNDLNKMLDICIATALSINPSFSKKEKKEILELCYMIRNANLFNHYLVSFPLINYSEKIDKDIDLSNLSLSSLKKEYFSISNSRKISLSPRFINYDELFYYFFIKNIVCGNSKLLTDKTVQTIREFFYKINSINCSFAKPFEIKIDSDKEYQDGYYFEKIFIKNKKKSLNEIHVAVANIKLDIDSCCMGLNDKPAIRNRVDFVKFLDAAYKCKVDYLVFPEYYLPLSWVQDVLNYTKKTGITVITGIQYICTNSEAHNVVGVFTRIKAGKYNSACAILREKNNYAPLEKKLLATEGYVAKDKDTPIYTCFDDGYVKYGLFLCYEFTDLRARGLFKDNVNLLFIRKRYIMSTT